MLRPQCALLFLACAAAPALAAPPTATSSTARAAVLPTPDVVRLKSGGILRGSITELIPGESVVLITGTGDVRRFPMAEVLYAGSAEDEPHPVSAAPPTPPPPTADDTVALALSSNLPEITFHLRTQAVSIVGAPRFTAVTMEPLCRAPCALNLKPGTYYLGLSRGDGGPVADPTPLVVTSSATALVGTYDDWSKLRIAGGVVAVSSIVASILAVALPLASDPDQDCSGLVCVPHRDFAPIVAGTSLGVAGAVVGVMMMLASDGAEVAVH